MEPEINVNVEIPAEGETPPEGDPVIVVVPETPPANAGTDPGTVVALEMLIKRIDDLELERDESLARFESVNMRLDGHSERLVALEVIEPEEDEDDGEIVAEVIPPASTEVVAEVQPVARKRRFI